MESIKNIIIDCEKAEIRCKKCGEVLADTSHEYLRNWPNSASVWADQLRKEHKPHCPINIKKAKKMARTAREYGNDVSWQEIMKV